VLITQSLWMKTAVFWDITSCRLVEVYQCFRGVYSIHHQEDRPTAQNIPEESHLHTRCSHNLKSHQSLLIFLTFFCLRQCLLFPFFLHCWEHMFWKRIFTFRKGFAYKLHLVCSKVLHLHIGRDIRLSRITDLCKCCNFLYLVPLPSLITAAECQRQTCNGMHANKKEDQYAVWFLTAPRKKRDPKMRPLKKGLYYTGFFVS
jgi:hypothetical protein